ncbi:MAG: hypothetical protein CVU47_10630 [Chloroflexi bacterium HGW-Chloroflexi-9]|nr:MAG: hypothetical protein CVU47_10630 [Chloroflexi bacterium HGW-Chloroflexi-9]
MKMKCGWVQIFDPSGQWIVARGAMSVEAVAGLDRGPWDGEVDLMRGGAPLICWRQLPWLVRFEQGHAQQWVQVRSLEQRWGPSGLRNVAHVRSYDHEFPPAISELGGG